MSRGLAGLKRSAAAACKWRGHSMRWSSPAHGDGKYTQGGECRKCGAYVLVNTRPQPNEINIGGDAVALNCQGEKKPCVPKK